MSETPDTSVLVPALAVWHPQHASARGSIGDVESVIAHVLVETFSVLTRLPAPHRIAPPDAAAAVAGLPWTVRGLSAEEHVRLVGDTGRLALSGGAVYGGLIAVTARTHGLTVLTRDRRSQRTYELLGADYRFIPDV